MEIPNETIVDAAQAYAVFAFDEGSVAEIRQANVHFNELVSEAYRTLTRSALMSGFNRPTLSEFRSEFMTQCRKYLRRKGMI